MSRTQSLNTSRWDKCILVGDFNAHNEAWNCRSTDTNGSHLLDCIDRHDLYLHNVDIFTHTNPSTGNKSAIQMVVFVSVPPILLSLRSGGWEEDL